MLARERLELGEPLTLATVAEQGERTPDAQLGIAGVGCELRLDLREAPGRTRRAEHVRGDDRLPLATEVVGHVDAFPTVEQERRDVAKRVEPGERGDLGRASRGRR